MLDSDQHQAVLRTMPGLTLGPDTMTNYPLPWPQSFSRGQDPSSLSHHG